MHRHETHMHRRLTQYTHPVLPSSDRSSAESPASQPLAPRSRTAGAAIFKEIKDSFGHSAGDELLQAVAQRLRERDGDRLFISRSGDDEFSPILKGHSDAEAGRLRMGCFLVRGARLS